MRIKIYQPFYEAEQYATLDKAFIPYNNLKNTQAELREYPTLKKLHKKHINFKGHWGAFSWRFNEKAKIDGNQFINWVKSNPGYDFYHVNPYAWIPALHRNIITQGEEHHPGMTNFFNKAIKHLGYSINIADADFYLDIFCLCHFHIANAKFWDRWFAFFDTIIELSEKDQEMYNYMYQQESDHRKEKIINYSFICERSISVFLYLHYSDFKVLHYPYKWLTKKDPKNPKTSFEISLDLEIERKALLLGKNNIY